VANNYWQQKKVLITGFAGFLGSHLTKALIAGQARVYGLDIRPERKQTVLSAGELAKTKVIKGNVENFSLLAGLIKKEKIEFIFHLAARALVQQCLKNPRQAFSTNIRGTWNVLEAAREQRSIKAVVIASSDKAYGIQKSLPYSEKMSLAGSHPYDASKSCADLLATTYYRTFKLPVCVTRCGNIFGPGDFNFSRLIPDAIRSALDNKTLIIRSNGKFIRDYLYVTDVIRGYLMLAQKMQQDKIFGQAFNFSNQKPISVLEMVKNIYQLCAKPAKYQILDQAEYEIKKQYLSAAKAKKVLNWKPINALEEDLSKTIAWYKNYLGKSK